MLQYFLIVFCFLIPTRLQAEIDIEQRCADDLIGADRTDLLEGRLRWFGKCFPDKVKDYGYDSVDAYVTDKMFLNGKPRPIVKFPVFVTPDMKNTWPAPHDKNAPCDVKAGYVPMLSCQSGCYTGGMRLAFLDGLIAIQEAEETRQNHLITLDENASLDDLIFSSFPVAAYSKDIHATTQPIVYLTMMSGGKLEVTPNHPLLDDKGVMRQADDLKSGDKLVREDGLLDEIVTINTKPFFGKVYNVRPNAAGKLNHILIAEGYLTGSSWYQNEGIAETNRRLLRSEMPVGAIR